MTILCMAAADDVPSEFDRLYYHTRYAEVWKIITIQKARRYSPKKT